MVGFWVLDVGDWIVLVEMFDVGLVVGDVGVYVVVVFGFGFVWYLWVVD